MQSGEEALRNVAPFLKSKVLRGIVRSFTGKNDFEQWATNAQVLDMLKEAQRLLDNGYITEEQLQKSLLAHLEVLCKHTLHDLPDFACQVSALPIQSHPPPRDGNALVAMAVTA